MSKIVVPFPELQTDFAKTLFTVRGLYLQDALRKAIEKTDLLAIDKQLHRFAPKKVLTELAAIGLRGELVFATPYLLKKSPSLLATIGSCLASARRLFMLAGTVYPFSR